MRRDESNPFIVGVVVVVIIVVDFLSDQEQAN